MQSWETNSPEETFEAGKKIASQLRPGDVLLIEGALGAGKTTLTKSIIQTLTGIDKEYIDSPTFTYVNEYGNEVYHFDLYRLQNEETFYQLGLDEYFHNRSLCIVEWPERCKTAFPSSAYRLQITPLSEEKRTITLEGL